MRVLVVDDHTLYQRTLCEFLGTLPQVSVCGQASDGQTGVRIGRQLEPEVLLTDLQLPNLDGFRLCERLRETFPQLQTIVYTEELLGYHERRRPECVDFFVSKDTIFEELPAILNRIGY